MAEFLRHNREDVMNVCITEYDEKTFISSIRVKNHEEGCAEGIVEGEAEGENKLSLNFKCRQRLII